MPNYSAELTPQDRWAVAAYIRALQLSQNAKQSDLPTGAKVETMQALTKESGEQLQNFATQWNLPSGPASTAIALPNPARMAQATVLSAAPAATATITPPSTTPTTPVKTAAPQTVASGGPATKSAAPLAAAAGDPAAGKIIYSNNCQPCHQPTRTGLPPMIPSLINIVKRVGADHIRSVVTNGIPSGTPAMPAFSNLSQTDINNLIAYLGTN
jgi:mono/diheme cytochrome c family protein